MQTYTVKDYEQLKGEDIWELIKGVFHMSPAPFTLHQRILRELNKKFNLYFDNKNNKKCEVFFAPFDVELAEDTIVQPDISVICDPVKITEKRCVGSPDLIIEVVSPSSKKKDTIEKLALYREFQVREYWIVFPKEKEVKVYVMDNGEYNKPQVYTGDETIRAGIEPGLTIDLTDIFKYD